MEEVKVESELEELYIAAVSGTADSGTTTTLVDSNLTEYDDDAFNDMILCIIAGTNKGQSRRISDFDGSTGTITVSTAFTKAIDNTSEYIIKHFVVAAAVGGDATLAKQTEIIGYVDDLETRLTLVRAGYLDYLSGGAVALASVCTEARLARLDAAISSRSSHAAADIWTVATRTLTDPDSYKADVSALALEATLTAIKGTTWSTETLKAIYDAIAALNDPTAGAIADAVWDEVTSGHVTAGTFGKLLADIKTETDTHPTLVEIEAGDMSLIKTETDKIPTLLTESQSHPTLAEIEASTVLALKAHLVHGSGDITPPTNKGIWDYLTNLDAAISGRAPANEYDTEMARITANVATEAKQDIIDTNVDDIETDTADIQPRVPRIVCHMDFWSDNDDEIALTTSAGADHNLPNLTIAGIPTGVTVIRVVAMLKIALIKDTSTADNAVNGATALKVDTESNFH